MPYAPRPIPGPAEAGLPVGGMDAQAPQGLPINLATAMQLAGVRPLDIEAATVQVRQSLALQLQARALLIPTLNAGIDYFRHDGVQQNIFTGPTFQKDRQSLFVGGGPSLFVGLTDAIFNPLAARRVVAARRADVQTARNDVLFTVSQAFFELQSARGRLLGVGASIARAELLVNFTTGARAEPDRPSGNQPCAGRASEPAANSAGCDSRLESRECPPGGGAVARA